jgi:hypothetical protein
MLKREGWFQTICFEQEEIYSQIYRRYEIKNLRRRHFLLSWGGSPVSSPSLLNTKGGGARVPGYDLKESSTEVCRDKGLLLCFGLLITSTHPRNSLSSCCSSLVVRSNHYLKHLDTFYPSLSVNFKTGMVLSLGSDHVRQLQGRFVSEFQREIRVWDPYHGSSATRGHLQHRTTNLPFGLISWIWRQKT